VSIGGSNVSNNSTIRNVAIGNGNHSSTQVTSSGGSGTTLAGGTTGNGNTTQTANRAGNIFNPQRSSSPGSVAPGSTTSANPQLSFGPGFGSLRSTTSGNPASGNDNPSSTRVSDTRPRDAGGHTAVSHH
jgi:hypothetical protein